MSDEIIETHLIGRPRPVGNQTVRRVLPAVQRRALGPFVFLDHMGPHRMPPGEGFDVRPHPHIGLSTVTYLFEGAIVHRDSLGSVVTIVPGELNWMTAGKGIVHSERSPDELRANGGSMHGLQLWVALPLESEEVDPSFQHIDAVAIPELGIKDLVVRLLAGTAYGSTAPVLTHSPLFFVEAKLAAGDTLPFPDEHRDRAVYVIEGAIEVGGVAFGPGDLCAVTPGDRVVVATSASHVTLLGGARLPEPRHLEWNFVSSSLERLEQAKADWRDNRFPHIPTDDAERIPLPEERAK